MLETIDVRGELGGRERALREAGSGKSFGMDEFDRRVAEREGDDEVLLGETFAYLLDREPVTSIGRDFPIDQPARRHADFWDELRACLA